MVGVVVAGTDFFTGVQNVIALCQSLSFSHITRLLEKKDSMNRLQLITNKLYKEEYEMFRTAKTVNKVRQ